MPDTDFSAWEARVGLPDAVVTAKTLGISRAAVYQLRSGATQPHPSTRRLMQVIEDNPELIGDR